MIVIPSIEALYVDIPKTGSNSLDTIFLSMGGEYIRPATVTFQKHGRKIPNEAKDYKRIVSVRNPYERMVSLYHFHHFRGLFLDLSFEQFVEHLIEETKKPSDTDEDSVYRLFPIWKYMEPIGKADYVIRLEHFEADYKSLPFELPLNIPHKNKNPHPKFEQMNVSREVIDKINEWAGSDFEDYGYERL